MRLIKLTSNKPQFKEVEFNKTGITIIKASRLNKDKEIDDSKKTTNGVGKSLIVHIIDFCLASDPIKQFNDMLNDWSFILYFSMNDREYKIERYCANQETIFLDDKKHDVKFIRDFLFNELFDKNEVPNSISFRSIMPRFLRSPSKGYFDIRKPNTLKESDYNSLLYTSWLLGLDISLVENKCSLVVQKKDDLGKAKSIKEYELSNISSERKYSVAKLKPAILDLEDKIFRKEENISKYKIAEDYREILSKADELTKELRDVEDNITSNNIILDQINNALKTKHNVSQKDLEDLFKDAKLAFPDQVKKSIAEVEIFHNELLGERKRRLEEEAKSYKKKIEVLEKKYSVVSKERDECLSYLGSHKALDEYNSIQQEVFDLKNKKDNLEKYLSIITKEQNIRDDFRLELEKSNRVTNEYLTDINEIVLNKLILNFRKLSSNFYQDKAGGITINNNEKENKNRFDINITIDDDSSHGVSEVKMFCLDVLLLTLRNHHKIDFIFHDSFLFSNMDPRQRLEVFQTMQAVTKEYNVQYICTVNEDQLEFGDDITSKEYTSLIEDNIVLELTDEGDTSKLLGERISLEL